MNGDDVGKLIVCVFFGCSVVGKGGLDRTYSGLSSKRAAMIDAMMRLELLVLLN